MQGSHVRQGRLDAGRRILRRSVGPRERPERVSGRETLSILRTIRRGGHVGASAAHVVHVTARSFHEISRIRTIVRDRQPTSTVNERVQENSLALFLAD